MIAEPGLLADYAADTECFAAPMFGADDVLALPGPGPYAELDVRLLFDLARANVDPANNGRSSGAYHTDPASSWYEALNDRNFWWGGGNHEPGLSSYTVGVIHLNATATDLWAVDYEPAGNRLLILPADPDTADTFVPRSHRAADRGPNMISPGDLQWGGQPAFPPGVRTLTAMTVETGPGEDLYRHADAGEPIGRLVAGKDRFLASRVTRIRRRDGGRTIRIHDNPDVDRLSVILADREVRIIIRTEAASVESGSDGVSGGNFANWRFGAAEGAVIDAIAEGARISFFLVEAAA